MSIKNSEAELSPAIYEDLATLLVSQIGLVAIVVTLINTGITAMSYSAAVKTPLLAWFGVVTLFQLCRYLYLRFRLQQSALPARRKVRIIAILSLISGLIQGSVLVITYTQASDAAGAMTIALQIQLCFALTSSAVGYAPVVMGFCVPVFALGAIGIVQRSWQLGELVVPDAVMIAMTPFVVIAIFALSQRIFGNYSETIELRRKEEVLNAELANALAESEAANRSKTRFLASASHDLRQPIHTLSLYTSTLNMRPLDKKTRDMANEMQSALDALSRQMDTLLDISKLDAGIVDRKVEPVSILEMLRRIELQYRDEAASTGIELQTTCSPGETLSTDPVLLERILTNLVSNAIKFIPTGSVQLRAKQVGDRLTFAVTDTGIGMEQDELEHIFQEFYQVDNPERDRNKGMGLGLSIVQRLTCMLEGTIEIVSSPGAGTSIEITLPALAGASPTTTSTTEPELAQWTPRRVLVVDDDATIRAGMRNLLEHLECTVETAEDINSALQRYETFHPDVVLSDYPLRDNEDGVMLINELHNKHPEAPALLISGDTAADRLQLAQQAGLTLLHKPVRASALQGAIARACAA